MIYHIVIIKYISIFLEKLYKNIYPDFYKIMDFNTFSIPFRIFSETIISKQLFMKFSYVYSNTYMKIDT